MNTYELADELQKMFVGEEYDRLVHEIPEVLRQQADRIAELEEENRRIRERTWDRNWDSDFARQFLAEIREEKERHGIK